MTQGTSPHLNTKKSVVEGAVSTHLRCARNLFWLECVQLEVVRKQSENTLNAAVVVALPPGRVRGSCLVLLSEIWNCCSNMCEMLLFWGDLCPKWRELGGLEAPEVVLELRNVFYGVLPEYREIIKNLIINNWTIFSGPSLVVTLHNTFSRIWAGCWLTRPVSGADATIF